MDIMAINADNAAAMKTAIETYVTEVEAHISKIESYTISAGDGFFGSGEAAAVDNYIAETCTEIGKIVRYFDEFQTALEQVLEDYAAKDAGSSTSAVNEAAAKRDDMITVNRFGA